MKKISLLMLSLFLMIFLVACSSTGNVSDEPNDDSNDDPKQSVDELIYLTLEELEEYDGSNGKDAYIAVDGKIYDVTDSNFWTNGIHNGFSAGRDLTDEIKNISPHGVDNLDRVTMIGEIVEGE